jgi:hypothetical protein
MLRISSIQLNRAEMRVIVATFMGLVALAVASAQAAPNPEKDNWVQLGAALLRAGRPSLRDRLASGALARLARRVVVGPLRSE